MNAVLKAAADRSSNHRDPDVEPEPLVCANEECGALMRWPWYEFKGRLPPRWLRPPNDVCDDCIDLERREREAREYQARQKAAGIPQRYQRYSFTNPTMQPHDMNAAQFRVYCRKYGKVGVTDGNLDAFEFCRDWAPGGGSAWLWGAVGGGKSHLASMLGSKLLLPNGEMKEIHVDGVLYVQVNRPKHVVFTSDEQLQADAKQAISDSKARREDATPDPVRRLISAAIVIYDDIGTHEGKWLTEMREAVVNGRYMRSAPTIFTSNSSPAASAHLFSPRMVDRFTEMFAGEDRVFSLRDDSWRSA
jgi:DNA replication protein DnaC